MKLLLIGNPNVGKTTLFNALTGGHGRTGNYCGVTVGVSERPSRFPGLGTVCDLPGLYSLDGMSMEETLAGDYIARQKREGTEFLAVQIADASTLVRSLRLTRALLALGIPLVLGVTMCRRFRRRGGRIDCAKIGRSLGLRCFEVDALRKKSVAAFAGELARLTSGAGYRAECEAAQNRKNVGENGGENSGKNNREAKLPEGYLPARTTGGKADRLFLNAGFALPAFFAAAGLVFFLTFGKGMPGDLLKGLAEALFARLAEKAGEVIDSPTVRSLVCDGLILGAGGVVSFLPQIALMYLFLDLLEESGFMSALAVMTDGLFSGIGLSGRAAFSVLLG